VQVGQHVKASMGLDSTTCTKSELGGKYFEGVEVSSVARDDSEWLYVRDKGKGRHKGSFQEH